MAPVTATNFGVTVEQLTPDLATYFGVATTSGVVVADVDHAASVAGLQRGDILIEVGGHAIAKPDDFNRQSRRKNGDVTLPRIARLDRLSPVRRARRRERISDALGTSYRTGRTVTCGEHHERLDAVKHACTRVAAESVACHRR